MTKITQNIVSEKKVDEMNSNLHKDYYIKKMVYIYVNYVLCTYTRVKWR